MFTKSEMIRITGCSSKDLVWARRNRIIPPSKKTDKTMKGETDVLYPEYALSDLLHVRLLREQKVKPKEIRRTIFGEEGEVLFEEDMEERTGAVLAVPINKSASEAMNKLTALIDETFPERKIVHQAFRTERRGIESFLILSRIVLRPADEETKPLKVTDDLPNLERGVLLSESAIVSSLVKEWIFPHLKVQKFLKERKKDERRCISLRPGIRKETGS